jgi:hypothetical protein
MPAPTRIHPATSPGSNASFNKTIPSIIPINGEAKKKTDRFDELCRAIRYCHDKKQNTLTAKL